MIDRPEEASSSPRIAFRTVGCRLNQAETARMAASCEGAGYAVVAFGEPCDVCVIHSCTVTANAERDSLRLARQAARAGVRPYVVLAGCAAEVDPEGVRRRSGADLVLAQRDKFNLPALLPAHLAGRAVPVDRDVLPLYAGTRAMVRVQDGCNFGCSYCIVPRARHRMWSRPVAETINEINGLVAAGYKEVVLTGANLGLYGYETAHDLIDLLRAIETHTDVPRIRLSSIESATVEEGLVAFMADSARVCRHLHLPLQSGDTGVLRAMRRRYTPDAYRRTVERAAAALPGLGLGTDIITGFPGESETAFNATCELVNALPFSNLHVFPYSERSGTDAAGLPDTIPPALRRKRARALIDIGRRKRDLFAARWVRREVAVLVERVDARGRGRGWSSEYVEVRLRAPEQAINTIVQVKPARCEDGVLFADL